MSPTLYWDHFIRIAGEIVVKINLNISPLENILMLINEKNGIDLSIDQVSVGIPSIFTGHTGENTEVVMTGIAGKGVKDSQTFYYNRYNLLGGKEPDPTSVDVLSTDTQEELSGKISAAYVLELSELIINDGNPIVLSQDANTPTNVSIAAVEGSLLYYGDPIATDLIATDL